MPDLVVAPGSTTSTDAMEFHVGFLGFPNLTQLDLTGPFETLARLPRFNVHIVARTLNRITGGGVTAGIDFGLYVAAELGGQPLAERIQLYLEYAPSPPFASGTPASAPTEVLSAYMEASAAMLERRATAVEQAAAALASDVN